MAEIVFIYDGQSIAIQSNINQKMKDICINLSNKINTDLNSLTFLYGGTILNLEKKYNEITKENKITILVYKNENEICSKCGRILNDKRIEDIISSNNKINNTLIGLKNQIENIILNLNNTKNINNVNTQLENIIILMNKINEDIKKINNELNIMKVNDINYLKINKKNGNIKEEEHNSQERRFNPNGKQENYDNDNQNRENMENEADNDIIEIEVEDRGMNTDELPPEELQRLIDNNIELKELNEISSMDHDNNPKLNETNEIKNCKTLKNEIICIYNKQKDEISLLHDYTYTSWNDEYKKYYIEGKNNINSNNIEIYINNKKMKFNYKYKSNEKGEIKVKFIFNKLLTCTFCMFWKCSSLISIDLSLFNITKVNNMGYMFSQCSSLKSIDLFSFDASNVHNMIYMFGGCSSLKKENVKINKAGKKILSQLKKDLQK